VYDYLSGRLAERGPDEVVVDVGGVGYQLFVSGQTLGRLPAPGVPGDAPPVTLFVHDLTRDERTVLYGFVSREERALFLKLLTVSRVGPGTALMLLSAMEPGALAAAVESGDHRALARVRGVGQRLAERLVVELKGRLADIAPLPGRVTDQRAAVAAALVALGFPRPQALQAADRVCLAGGTGAPLEGLVKQALRLVGKAAGAAEPTE
jgi:Holliday junction DNA helicase RuvA